MSESEFIKYKVDELRWLFIAKDGSLFGNGIGVRYNNTYGYIRYNIFYGIDICLLNKHDYY